MSNGEIIADQLEAKRSDKHLKCLVLANNDADLNFPRLGRTPKSSIMVADFLQADIPVPLDEWL